MSPSEARRPLSHPASAGDFSTDLYSFGAAAGFDAFKSHLETRS